MNRECDRLDAFLNGELARDDALRFGAHVVECEACREAIDQQQWIDGLLRSPERLGLEPAPSAIGTSIRQFMKRLRQVRLAACGLAAAVLVGITAGWIVVVNRQAKNGAEPVIAQAVIADTEHPRSPSAQATRIDDPPRAVFVGGTDVFVAAVESKHPNVTIVRLYPTYKPDFEPEPSVEAFDLDHFNGG